MKRTHVAILLAATLIGCTPATPRRPGSTSGPADSVGASGPVAAADSTAHASGFGRVRAGMTVAEAEAALGTRLMPQGAPTDPCYHLVLEGRPGVAFMIVDGRIARLEVGPASSVRTAEGAGVGDTEARIHALYHGRVEVQPHKYEDGHYLVVTPPAPADSAYRMIFETDGKRVTSYRTGRLPEVEWVEGCS